MFNLTTISDLVQIPPHEFHRPDAEEIEDKINAKYSNKVLPRTGLCVAMYDLLSASDGLIAHGTGNVNVNVTFRLLVFRPFRGEIIVGRIDRQDERGIGVSVEFFEDIHVPAGLLFPGSVFDATERVWIWHNRNPNDDTVDQLYFDNGNTVRLRIEAEHWTDQMPNGDKEDHETEKSTAIATTTGLEKTNGSSGGGGGGDVTDGGATVGAAMKRKVPYRIEGSMAEPGLGDVLWW